MATGKQNKLTGQIGEHLVAAKLGTMGILATPFSGNVPGFDISAVDPESGKTFVIQVKTSTANNPIRTTIDKWAEFHIDENGVQHVGKPLPLKNPKRIWVLVNVRDNDLTTARYFIGTETEIQKLLIEDYTRFLEKVGFKRPRNPNSTTLIPTIKAVESLEDNWKLLQEDAHFGG